MTKTWQNQAWLLAERPEGRIKNSDFRWSESTLGEPEPGQVLVRTVYLSLDPTNRIWMSDAKGYLPPVQIGDVMRGMTLGVVEASADDRFKAGDQVQGVWGWQRFALVAGDDLNPIPQGLSIPLDAWMSILGATGMTAYFGFLEIGQPKEGETVVVSAAAGAVGSLVGQIAKIKGCRVVGIAGTQEKCRWLTEELGFDAAINYKSEDVGAALDQHCPDGIDINFENVGGKILDLILQRINLRARIVLCGLISQYNAVEPVPGPYYFAQILMQRARVEGFIILDYIPRFPEGIKAMAGWLAQGKIRYRNQLLEGLEQAAEGVNQLFDGGNIGKLLVKVSEP